MCFTKEVNCTCFFGWHGLFYYPYRIGQWLFPLPVTHGVREQKNHPVGSSLNKRPSRFMTEHEVSHGSEFNVTGK